MYADLYTHASYFSRLRCFVFTLILLFMSASALAQHEHSHSRKTEAELHIRVHVVPVVMRPPHKRHTEDSNISYNLTDEKQGMEIKEEVHPLVGATGSGSTTNAVLKTVTIVLQ